MADCPVVGVVGRSGVGKTYFLERLIPALHDLACDVAVVKHTHHCGLETDRSGTDSYRLWAAGAENVVLASPDRTVCSYRHSEEPGLSWVLTRIEGVDLVLLEGCKRSGVPKLELVRAARSIRPLGGLVNRLAFVTDVAAVCQQGRCFELDDYEAVARFLVQRLDN